MGERIDLVSFGGPNGTSYLPDVLVARREAEARPLEAGEGRSATALEAVLIDVSDRDPEEVRHT
jgi:hypothetical protein